MFLCWNITDHLLRSGSTVFVYFISRPQEGDKSQTEGLKQERTRTPSKPKSRNDSQNNFLTLNNYYYELKPTTNTLKQRTGVGLKSVHSHILETEKKSLQVELTTKMRNQLSFHVGLRRWPHSEEVLGFNLSPGCSVLHVLPVPAWVSSGVLPQSKDIRVN